MRDYADRLEQPILGDQPLRGYLSGSIDVVFRVPGSSGHRYVVADWKTNLLGERGHPLTAADYAPDRLAEAMLHSHYPLQALLYSVVLHRFLRWRLPGYSPAEHLGGVRLPLPAWHVRTADAARRRAPRWGLQLAAATRAGDLAVRPARSEPTGGAGMIELFEVDSPHDRRIAQAASGLLRTFNEAGVFTAGDLHVAGRIGAVLGVPDEELLLAVALAVRAVRGGSVCVDLTTVPDLAPDLPWPDPDGWRTALAESPLVSASVLHLEGDLLYLDRYWREEGQVVDDVLAAGGTSPADPRPRRPGRGAGTGLPAARLRRAAGGRPGRALTLDRRADRRPRHRKDHRGRGTARPARRAVAHSRCGSRSRPRPARPPRGSRRPCATRPRSCRPRTGPGSAPSRGRPCTGCWGAAPRRGPASGTTGATACPTTWSWSTSRRWSP